MTKFAVIFPGQGSQSINMLAELAEKYNVVTDTFNQASDVLGYDLWALTQEGPEDQLNQTEYTQPAMLAAGIAAWRTTGLPLPDMTAGHSLGEYSALVLSGALKFTDAVKLVSARGQYMAQTMPDGLGAMGAIVGLSDEAVKTICEQASGEQIVAPANFNAIGQVVIAGHTKAVERALALAREAKLARRIPVSVPCHCDLLKPAADLFAEDLARTDFRTPEIPVIRNLDAKYYQTPDDIRQGLKSQLYQPVQWVATIQAFVTQGITDLIEPGPGRVLTGLTKRIDKKLKNHAVYHPASVEELLCYTQEKSH